MSDEWRDGVFLVCTWLVMLTLAGAFWSVVWSLAT